MTTRSDFLNGFLSASLFVGVFAGMRTSKMGAVDENDNAAQLGQTIGFIGAANYFYARWRGLKPAYIIGSVASPICIGALTNFYSLLWPRNPGFDVLYSTAACLCLGLMLKCLPDQNEVRQSVSRVARERSQEQAHAANRRRPRR